MPAYTPLIRTMARQPLRQLPRLQKRSFSIIERARAVARAAEAHPFERMPLTQAPAKPDWGKQFRHVGDAALLYVYIPLLYFPVVFGFCVSGADLRR